MSLLDTEEMIRNEINYKKEIIINDLKNIELINGSIISQNNIVTGDGIWLKYIVKIKTENSIWDSKIQTIIYSERKNDTINIRLSNPLTKENEYNEYCFFVKIPNTLKDVNIKTILVGGENYKGEISFLNIIKFTKKKLI